ncbi:hypothetical protein B0J12DRAFT_278402 [Macrophomina phaseolina]|uniref:Zn(2)-C6 fungal-type domain-containing protein n=1 Tax=Macrophomina phaseolina TaxID=35725 RepID=A0ABQ8FXH8_9PEZI|nr:hypothetical protein B0J12DRAFT_278402 [Macrophomina phaseolina]
MVGVPGRSNGCHTCRARHIKCDERKPTCRRCEKSGYTCQGYTKTIHFLIHTTSGASSSPSGAPSPSTLGAPSGRILQKAKPPAKSRTAQDQRKLARRKQQWAYSLPTMPQELGLEGWVEDMAFSFTFSNFLYNNFGRPWLQLAAQGAIDDMSLAACKAFALGFFGNSQRQRWIQEKGAKENGISLRLLIKELPKADRVNAAKYIIPVMLLLLYNNSVCKNADFSHHEGLAQLILLCGPESFQHQPLLNVFEATRDLLILKALLERKRTFFEEDMWKTVPWALNPSAKSPTNHLLDILADVPGFLEDEKTIKQANDGGLRKSLRSRVEQRLQDVYQWRWAWESRNPRAAFEVSTRTSAQMPSSEIPRGLETSLIYTTWLQASEICLYNAVLIWLLSFLGELRPAAFAYLSPSLSASFKPSHPSPLLLPGQVRSLRQPAMEICRSFQYLLDSFAESGETPLSWLMPISLAYYIVQEDREYVGWIRMRLDGCKGKAELPAYKGV